MRKVKSRRAGTWEWLNFILNRITVTDALLEGIVLFVLHFTLLILFFFSLRDSPLVGLDLLLIHEGFCGF